MLLLKRTHYLLAFLLFSAVGLYGQRNYLRGSEIYVNTGMEVVNDLYTQVGAPAGNINSSTEVRLKYDDLKILSSAKDFTITVEFDLKLYPQSSTGHPVIERGSLIVQHTESTQEVLEEQVYKTGACYKAELVITSITGGANITEDIVLELEILYDRAEKFLAYSVPFPSHTEDWDNGEINFHWGSVTGAQSYELEWLFKSSDYFMYTPYTVQNAPYERATRVVTAKQDYTISVPYNRGLLYYRLRAVNSQGGQKFYSQWGYCNTYINININNTHLHEKGKSWSYTAMYSSDGLKSEQISYVDATGRVRQQIVKDQSNGNIIVGEQKYGFNGEPSVQVLPGIVPGKKLNYLQNFTTVNGVPFDKMHFGKDASLNNATAKIDANDDTHSNNYFSKENQFKKDGLHSYVASAEGYGYAQTMFDAQGRVTKVSGVGADHKMGSGHEVEIFYSNPDQKELDRLFGNEVGYADHYSKVATKDANGVVSTSYYNLSGQLIATAIAGDKPVNLEELPVSHYAATTTETKDLSTYNEYSNGSGHTDINYDFFVSKAQEYEFHYEVTKAWYTANCQSGNQDCAYLLEVSMSNNQDVTTPLKFNSSVVNKISVEIGPNSFNSNGKYLVDFKADLLVGQYKLIKSLRVDPSKVTDLVKTYKDAIAAGTACTVDGQTKTIKSLETLKQEFRTEYLKGVRCDDCEFGCAHQTNAFFTYVVDGNHPSFAPADIYTTTVKWMDNLKVKDYENEYADVISDGAYQWSDIYATCVDERCAKGNIPTPDLPAFSCAGMRDMLLRDLSPGGQYFDNKSANEDFGNFIPVTPSDAWLRAKVNGFTLTTTSPSNSYSYAPSSGIFTKNGTVYSYTDVSNEANWDEKWAEGFLQFHPEYCEYTSCLVTDSYQGFTGDLLQMTYSEAQTKLNGVDPMGGTLYKLDTLKSVSVIALSGGASSYVEDENILAGSIVGDWKDYFDDFDVTKYSHPSTCIVTSTSSFMDVAKCMAEQQADVVLHTNISAEREQIWDAYKSIYLSLRGRYLAQTKILFKTQSACANAIPAVTSVPTDADEVTHKGSRSPYTYSTTIGGQLKIFATNFPDMSLLSTMTASKAIPGGRFGEIQVNLLDNLVQQKQNEDPSLNCDGDRYYEIDLYNGSYAAEIYTGYNIYIVSQRAANSFYSNKYASLDVDQLYSYDKKLLLSNWDGRVETKDKIASLITGINAGTSQTHLKAEYDDFKGVVKVKYDATYSRSQNNDAIAAYPFLIFDIAGGYPTSSFLVNDVPVKYSSDCCEEVNFYLCHFYGWDTYTFPDDNEGLYGMKNQGFKIWAGGNRSGDDFKVLFDVPRDAFSRGETTIEEDYKVVVDYIQSNYEDIKVDYSPTDAPQYFCAPVPVNSWGTGGVFKITLGPSYRDLYTYKFAGIFTGPYEINSAINTQGGTGEQNGLPLSVPGSMAYKVESTSCTSMQTPNCFCSTLLQARNEEWLNKYNVNAPLQVGQSVDLGKTNGSSGNDYANETGAGSDIFSRLAARYSSLYPIVTTNALDGAQAAVSNPYTSNNYDQWTRKCLAKNYLFEAGTDPDQINNSSNLIIQIPAVEYLTSCTQVDCKQEAKDRADLDATIAFEKSIEEEVERFRENYLKQCMTGSSTGGGMKEGLTMKYINTEYQYTLYYYDLVGNLVATVYPDGVRVLNDDQVAQVQEYRKTNANTSSTTDGPIYLADQHLMAQVNRFKYNSLGEVRESHTTDQGDSKFWYDNLGRLLVSQNAQQQDIDRNHGEFKYSYTTFDAIGRIAETGELVMGTNILPMNDNIARGTGLSSILSYDGWLKLGNKNEVTKIYYDDPFTVYGDNHGHFVQSDKSGLQNEFNTYGKNKGLLHTRNRITAVQYFEDQPGISEYGIPGASVVVGTENNTMAYYYGYNEHGLAETFVQQHKILKGTPQEFKTLNYDFDLFTGQVKQVEYQPGKEDQFYSRYEYDELNRLKRTFTSTDRVIWNLESKNIFYLHGAKARIELGKHQVQGIDLAYTVRGELKGMNSATLSARRDIGADGQVAALSTYQGYGGAEQGSYKKQNKYFGRDAAGFTLGYFKGDYHTAGQVYGQDAFEAYVTPSSAAAAAIKNLYNGSITSSATAIYNKDGSGKLTAQTQLSAYSYDLMYRLKEVQVFSNANNPAAIIASNSWESATLYGSGFSKETSSYFSRIDYDMNGNITHLKRNTFKEEGTDFGMDDLTYTYNKSGNDLLSNRLYHVQDADNKNGGNDYKQTAAAQTGSGVVETANDFTYDNLGSIIKNKADGYQIEWTASRKVKTITRLDENKSGDNLEFKYDAFGRRICKIVKERKGTTGENNSFSPFVEEAPAGWSYEYYALDPSGNTIATYEHIITPSTPCASAGYSTAVIAFNSVTGYTGGPAGPGMVLNIGDKAYPAHVSFAGNVENFKNYITQSINNSTSSPFKAELVPEICSSCLQLTAKERGTAINTTAIYFSGGNYANPITVLKQVSGSNNLATCGTVTSSILKGHLIYADTRLGVLKKDKTLSLTTPVPPSTPSKVFSNIAGQRYYEIVNWLGSVNAVVRDMKHWETDPMAGTIYQTGYEGGDEKLFRNSYDAVYNKVSTRAHGGEHSLYLESAGTELYGVFGPNIRESVKTGNSVDIDFYAFRTNSTDGGGMVYEFKDDNNNQLYNAQHQGIWNELHVTGSNQWTNYSVHYPVPVLYNGDGSLYSGAVTLLVYPWVPTGNDPAWFDDLRVSVSRSNEQESYFAAVIEESHDYHEFGMEMANRGFPGNGSYKYGYQGSEKDNEVNSADGTSYTTEFRQLDPRLGRWFSVDPVFQPWQSPYTSMDNNPINLNDVRGTDTKKENKTSSSKKSSGEGSKGQDGTTACAHCNELKLSGPKEGEVESVKKPSEEKKGQVKGGTITGEELGAILSQKNSAQKFKTLKKVLDRSDKEELTLTGEQIKDIVDKSEDDFIKSNGTELKKISKVVITKRKMTIYTKTDEDGGHEEVSIGSKQGDLDIKNGASIDFSGLIIKEETLSGTVVEGGTQTKATVLNISGSIKFKGVEASKGMLYTTVNSISYTTTRNTITPEGGGANFQNYYLNATINTGIKNLQNNKIMTQWIPYAK